MPILVFEAKPAVAGFISSALETKTDLSDLLIAHCVKFSGCECVLTFDKEATRSGLIKLIR